MCNGSAFESQFRWAALDSLARADFKPDVPNGIGVYCVKVRSVGTTDMNRIVELYRHGGLMKALALLADESRSLFKATALSADHYGWEKFNATFGYESAIDRSVRLIRVPIQHGALTCPILYVGGSGRLRTRLDELAFGGHTASHAIWPLLLNEWKLDIGWNESEDWRVDEAELKKLYRSLHGGLLPPLMDR